jgi:hypothetical protein
LNNLWRGCKVGLFNKARRKSWLNYLVYRFQSQIIGNGSTKAPAASFLPKCSSIQMANADHVVAIARMQRRQSALLAQLSKLAAHTHSQCKSHTESGAVYLKMIAQYCLAKKSQQFTKHHKDLNKNPPYSLSAGDFLFTN